MTSLQDFRTLVHDMPELKGEVVPSAHLTNDLGLDSICKFEIVVWLEDKYGIPVEAYDPKRLEYVKDVLDLIHAHRRKD